MSDTYKDKKGAKKWTKDRHMPKCSGIGPGGWDCNCCAPAPGSKDRRIMIKRARRIEAREHWKNQLDRLPNGE